MPPSRNDVKKAILAECITSSIDFCNVTKFRSSPGELTELDFCKAYYSAWIVSMLIRPAIAENREDDDAWTSYLLHQVEYTSKIIHDVGNILDEHKKEKLESAAVKVVQEWESQIESLVDKILSSGVV